jgi:hypothetical protein
MPAASGTQTLLDLLRFDPNRGGGGRRFMPTSQGQQEQIPGQQGQIPPSFTGPGNAPTAGFTDPGNAGFTSEGQLFPDDPAAANKAMGWSLDMLPQLQAPPGRGAYPDIFQANAPPTGWFNMGQYWNRQTPETAARYPGMLGSMAEGGMPSTNNWRLLPGYYKQPNYFMLNGTIFDRNKIATDLQPDLFGDYTRSGVAWQGDPWGIGNPATKGWGYTLHPGAVAGPGAGGGGTASRIIA